MIISIMISGDDNNDTLDGVESDLTIDISLDAGLNQLVQAHTVFGSVDDDSSFGKKDDGYRYTLPVIEPLT